MAGEIEEPFRHSFQADSLHSGSISFGRFKNEDLCWERRSSFSHNRYLEEVERYSKPGSVTEKKAILEAHFRRRALLSQSSSESHNSGNDCQISGNEANDLCENANNSHFSVTESTGYDGDFDGSVYDGEHESNECEREDCENSCLEPLSKPAEVVLEHFQVDEGGCSPVTGMVNPELEIHTEEDFGGGENVTTSSAAAPIPTSPKIDKDGRTNSEPREKLSPKVRSASQIKQLKSRSSLVNAVKATSIISKVATKDLVKDVTRKPRRQGGISSSVREKPVLQSAAAPSYCSVSRTPKNEVSSSLKSKVHKESKSTEKEMRTKEKVVHKVHQNADRHKKDVASTTQSTKQNSSSAFSFKSEERAERRKEFSMKMEEKIHAKEAEMHQLQTRKQEKSEAEIRRLRRSLNFKATPMPSFYHEAGQQSDRNKSLANESKSSKPQRNHSSSHTRAAENDTSSSGATNNGAQFTRKDLNISASSQQAASSSVIKHRSTISSDGSVSSPLRAASNPRARAETPVVKNEQETSSTKPKTREVVKKANKSPKVIKKDIKGVHLGSNSRMNCFAVGVAS